MQDIECTCDSARHDFEPTGSSFRHSSYFCACALAALILYVLQNLGMENLEEFPDRASMFTVEAVNRM